MEQYHWLFAFSNCLLTMDDFPPNMSICMLNMGNYYNGCGLLLTKYEHLHAKNGQLLAKYGLRIVCFF